MSFKIPSFVAVDLETTGLEYDKDEIIEIALVLFENNKPVKTLDYLVKPRQDLRSFIEVLTGITKDDLLSAAEFVDVAGEVRAFIGDLPIVAHNAQFDFKFLKNAFGKVGIDFENHPVYDSLTISRIAFQDVPNHRLETLVRHLGIERSAAHRALPDAEACGSLFVLAQEALESLPAFEKSALAFVAKDSIWKNIFNEPNASILDFEPGLKTDNTDAILANTNEKWPRVADYLGPEGTLSKTWPHFVSRDNQMDYASAVERNMYKGGLSVLEAPTGTGKTLAYLLSASLKAVSGERVVISTATRALQEQLLQHELPKIEPFFQGKLKAMVLKGRQNYICYRKFKDHLDGFDVLVAPEEKESFMALIPWVQRSTTGDINENSGFNHLRNKSLWSKLSSDASSCLGESCSFYNRCPALEAKRKAAKSNLLFVNHALFLSDFSLDFAILPTYEHIVFDEAHRLPSLSHQSFGRSVRFFDLRHIFKTLVHLKAEDKGLIANIEADFLKSKEENVEALEELTKLRESITESEKLLHRFFMKIGKKLSKQKLSEKTFKYKLSLFAELDCDPKPVLESLSLVKSLLTKTVSMLRDKKAPTGLTRDLEGWGSDIEKVQFNLEFVTAGNKEDWVFYLEEPFNPHTLCMNAVPLNTGSFWAEKFYSWIKSATFTSATLSVHGSLDYFAERMGMTASLPQNKKPFFRVYGPEAGFLSKRKIGIASFLPKPSAPEFQSELELLLAETLPDIEKNVLVLFTSVSSMLKVQKVLVPLFAKKSKLLLCQHADGSVDSLVDMFRKERGACLLGCQTMWEGVDLPGDALEVLIIPRLPFPNPADPLISGQAEQIKEQGGNPFKSLFVPEAYIGLSQGIGRLIRSEQDAGSILLLDNRLVLEPYGKTFLRIWNNEHQVLQDKEGFKNAL